MSSRRILNLSQFPENLIESELFGHKKGAFTGAVDDYEGIFDRCSRGRMRDDFFYRLCSDIITVPPLRQRVQEDPAELDDLLAHTVRRMLGKPSPEVSKMVHMVIDQQLGDNYPWPGNVRELEQMAIRGMMRSTL